MADETNRLSYELEALKKKYFAALTESEKREHEQQEIEAFLRRSLSRLSLLGDGLDKQLDAQLDRLRNAIRANQSSYSLAGLVERIMETAAIEQRQAFQQKYGPEMLLSLLNSLPVTADQQNTAAALRRKLQDKQAVRQIDTLTSEFVQLLSQRTLPPANTPKPSDTRAEAGLLGRLFGKRPTEAGSPATPPSGQHEAAHQTLVKLLDLIEPSQEHRSQLISLRDRLQTDNDISSVLPELARLLTPGEADTTSGTLVEGEDILLQLLSRLSLPDELHPVREDIRHQLKNAEDKAALTRIIEAIAALISEAQNLGRQEKQALEDFLQQITLCLTELSTNLDGTDTLRAQAMANTQQFSNSMQQHMEGIEVTVQNATELGQLKTVIQTRLTIIRKHLTDYRDTDSVQSEALEQQIAQLKGQVADLEQESAHLHEHLRQQQQKATIDPLTGVPNRLAYNERLETEVARWQRYGHALTMTVWDIDRFKSINDSYGHQAGDKVLKATAQILMNNMRNTDFIARYGGEEFVILMPETELVHALNACEKLRRLIEQSPFHYQNQAVPVTISCGIAQFHPGDSAEQAFERADAALYRAKQGGRNQCITEPLT